MDAEQIEILVRAQSARLIAVAHGYDATAEALSEIIEVLAHSCAYADRVRDRAQPLFGTPSGTEPHKPFQVAS